MAFTYIGNANAVGTGVSSLDCNRPAGIAVGQLVVAVYAFEGVAAGSGPWIIPNIGQFSSVFIGPAFGWQQACWQAPSASGVGIEVWWAIHGSGTHQTAQFVAAQNVVTVCASWSGEYNPTGSVNPSTVRLAPTAQVTGNAPPAPAVVANANELVIACGGDLMTASLFGTPSGFTNRVDVQRSGAGTVEATLADAAITSPGNTGPITFPNAASATTTKGSTATLVIRPTPTVAGQGGVLDAAMPPDLVVPGGWKYRFTAIDPVTGAVVPGVNVNLANVVATDISASAVSDEELGPFMLVPGPDA